MSKIICKWMSLAVMILLMTSCVKDEPEEAWSLAAGDKVPEFSIVMNDGSVVTTESLRGKTAVIIFFNTSCEDCREELAEMQSTYIGSMMSGSDIDFICISREEGAASVAAYWEKNGLTMPYSAQTDRTVYNLFASSGIPRIYYISPSLIITKAILAE